MDADVYSTTHVCPDIPVFTRKRTNRYSLFLSSQLEYSLDLNFELGSSQLTTFGGRERNLEELVLADKYYMVVLRGRELVSGVRGLNGVSG